MFYTESRRNRSKKHQKRALTHVASFWAAEKVAMHRGRTRQVQGTGGFFQIKTLGQQMKVGEETESDASTTPPKGICSQRQFSQS